MRNIIKENKGLIKAIIKKITGSYNEDIEQEVYIKTWKNINNYKETGKLRSWIATITANVCKDYFKSSSYKQNLREVRDENVLENKAVSASQERIIDAKKRQKIILKAVDDLPYKMRKVLVLFEFEDFSIAEIAKKLGEPEGTIKSRLYTARKTLAEKLKFLLGEN
ncbi:MAG: RNA polymerase sigma factor [Alphaproteobacteria bacterium]|nr:RNA polymerase sigma factor [Alphaproteobacteria bacterium]